MLHVASSFSPGALQVFAFASHPDPPQVGHDCVPEHPEMNTIIPIAENDNETPSIAEANASRMAICNFHINAVSRSVERRCDNAATVYWKVHHLSQDKRSTAGMAGLLIRFVISHQSATIC